MTVDWAEAAAKLFEPAEPKWASPLDMAKALDHKTVRTPALEAINEALVWAFTTPDARLIIQAPPQNGKSQVASRRFPLWALTQNPELRITIASYETGVARRWGRAIRDDIKVHAQELGLKIRDDVGAQGEWQLDGHDGGVFTAGIGSALTGRPSELMIIDDPVKNRDEADSVVKRETAWNWWLETAQTRLHPGTPVILILTRWHHQDLAGMLLDADGGDQWRVVNVKAQADHDPDKGETDLLGRAPGEYMTTVKGMTPKQWERRKRDSGPRTWAALYQGNPSPTEGGVFPAEWARYNQKLWTEREDGVCLVPGIEREDHELAISADLAFRDKATSDFVVIQVWLRVGVYAYLVDQIRRRMNFNDTLLAIKAISAKWPQAIQKFIEARANGDAAINALSRELVGLIPIEPEGSKHARASAVSPLAFSGNIILPTSNILPNVDELIEEARGFGTAAHDDTIDAMSQAVNRLLLMPLLAQDQRIVEPDVYDGYDERGFYFSPV